MIVGLNGTGKTTLGRALAEALGWFRMDVEDYWFPPASPSENPYAVERSRNEVRALMLRDMERHGRFVLSSVRGEWGEAIESRVAAVIVLDAPLETRLSRIDRRSEARFGARVAPGGDMYAQEQRFREIAAARSPQIVEAWVSALSLPVLRLDAARPVNESLSRSLAWLREIGMIGEAHVHA